MPDVHVVSDDDSGGADGLFQKILSPMVSYKKIYRVTKKGKISKVVREHYLRQDIPCSSKRCLPCTLNLPQDSLGHALRPVLSDEPMKFPGKDVGHYLVPDTNIFYHCMDVVEHRSVFQDVIVLQTVLEELRNLSLPLYNRLRALTNLEEKRFYVFHNEFRAETYIKQKVGETVNDRNDRAIRVAIMWYRTHLEESLVGTKSRAPQVILLSNDAENGRRARLDKIDHLTLKAYIKLMPNSDELLDMLSSMVDPEGEQRPREISYPEYLPMSQLQAGIRNGAFQQGTFDVSRYNYLEGSVSSNTFDRPPLFLGRENMNRAIAGDIVVYEILPKEQWKRPSAVIVDEDSVTKKENPDQDDTRDLTTSNEEDVISQKQKDVKASDSNMRPTAKVVGVLKRNWRLYVGQIDGRSVSSTTGRVQRSVFFVPMDKRIPRVRIRTRQCSALLGQRVLVGVDAWDSKSKYPDGHFVRTLGEAESKGAETEAILLEFDVQYRPFPKAVLDCLPEEGTNYRVPEDKSHPRWHDREDFRNLLVASIDPPSCQDIDDALHARYLPNGNVEAGVHIADVSHFVKPDTAIDDEANNRGTTVYLVDKRIDMLPMLLGTDLCSLKPFVERFAFSVIWELTQDAEIVNVRFTKSVIASKEAFSYDQAQLRIDDKSQKDELTESLRLLLLLSKKLKKKRMDAGALNLASPEVRIQTESETSDPQDVEIKELKETNSLVEEFMLLANISVAKKIYETLPQAALLRRHPSPPATNFEALQNMLRVRKGMTLSIESSKALATTLDRCVDPNESYFNTLLRILATRCMMSAEYFCSGEQNYSEFRHYGLASEIYTHFTSPIRRYADVIVHRQLAAAVEYESLNIGLRNKEKIASICQNINKRHRNGQFAGRASVDYFVGQTLKDKVSDEEGFIMRVFANGFVIFVPRFGIESVIRIRELAEPAPTADFEEDAYILSIKSRNAIMRIALFDKVKVRVSVGKTATSNRIVQLSLLEPHL